MNKKSLDGLYDFMRQAYGANWQYRFAATAYMSKANARGLKESVLAHQWSLMILWFQLRRVATELDKVVDETKLYEILMIHDLGETFSGDTPMVAQMAGKGRNKQETERKGIQLLGKNLPSKNLSDMLTLFDKFEMNPQSVSSIEFLLARFIDYLQGAHFALVFGNDLSKHSEIISKIVRNKWVECAMRLIDVLKQKGFKGAAEEVRLISNHHIADNLEVPYY